MNNMIYKDKVGKLWFIMKHYPDHIQLLEYKEEPVFYKTVNQEQLKEKYSRLSKKDLNELKLEDQWMNFEGVGNNWTGSNG